MQIAQSCQAIIIYSILFSFSLSEGNWLVCLKIFKSTEEHLTLNNTNSKQPPSFDSGPNKIQTSLQLDFKPERQKCLQLNDSP